MRVKEPRERLKKLKNGQPMSKKEIDDAAIALKKEKERARKAAYRAANPEKEKAAQAKYRATNPEKINARQRAYRAAKKAKAAATGDNHD